MDQVKLLCGAARRNGPHGFVTDEQVVFSLLQQRLQLIFLGKADVPFPFQLRLLQEPGCNGDFLRPVLLQQRPNGVGPHLLMHHQHPLACNVYISQCIFRQRIGTFIGRAKFLPQIFRRFQSCGRQHQSLFHAGRLTDLLQAAVSIAPDLLPALGLELVPQMRFILGAAKIQRSQAQYTDSPMLNR